MPDAILPRYYAAADIVAVPCRSRCLRLEIEGFGIVYLEAAASGKPAIAGRSGGTDEAVVDGVTGLLVDGSSAEDVAEAVRRLLSNPEASAATGRAGRERAERLFAWPRLSYWFGRVLREAAAWKRGQEHGNVPSSRWRSSCNRAASATPPYRARWKLAGWRCGVSETALGVVAAGWGVIMALSPVMQIRRMIRLRSSRDVSISYIVIVVVGFSFWIAYGIAIRNPALIVPNTLALLVGVVTVAVAVYFRTPREGRSAHLHASSGREMGSGQGSSTRPRRRTARRC